MKDIKFLGTSLDDIKTFTLKAKKDAGFELDRVQRGMEPIDWKPMTTVAPGVREIRIKAGDQYRIIYVANIGDFVYVLHAFKKKTQKTAKADIELARDRFKRIKP